VFDQVFDFLGVVEHKNLGQNGYSLQVDREGPQELLDGVAVMNENRKGDAWNKDEKDLEGVVSCRAFIVRAFVRLFEAHQQHDKQRHQDVHDFEDSVVHGGEIFEQVEVAGCEDYEVQLLSLLIVLLMRFKEPYKSSYYESTARYDTFQIFLILIPCIALAVFVHYGNAVKELLWTFSIYLEAVAILPQIFVLHYTKTIENLTAHYMFFLGSYRGLYILNWIYRYLTEMYYRQWLVWISGAIQTVLYVDFFFHYIKA
jgi:ER lumen protein retaining receptor